MVKFLKKLFGEKESNPLSKAESNRKKTQKVEEKPYKEMKIPAKDVDRNLQGQKLEKEGYVDNAIEFYEKNVEERFEGSFPYNRLAVIYRRRKQYDEEIRVLKQAIDVYEEKESSSPRKDVNPKLEKFRERLEKVESF
ncbi:tetratricopeptide repeat protein [Sediminibacillus massiliensis]|uniref:tetratricopeptide repeat protein n=1 Tax=Sediminibacillus massiliensis TaxID=1926277 RepID=UPI0009883BAE|nr:tetratricopeptide repeat protein [Sediminibacillus massiliensis]